MKKKLILSGLMIVMLAGLSACTYNPDVPAERTKEQIEAFSGELSYELPEGFEKVEELEGATYYLHVDYPEVESNVSVAYTENDGSFQFLKAKNFVKKISDGLKKNFDEEPKTEILEEKFFELDGRRAFMYTAKYEVAGQSIVQITYVIENDENLISITYTERNGEEFFEAFKASGEGICFK